MTATVTRLTTWTKDRRPSVVPDPADVSALVELAAYFGVPAPEDVPDWLPHNPALAAEVQAGLAEVESASVAMIAAASLP